jgi:hypothetical protein
MSSTTFVLPSFDKLGIEPPEVVDAEQVARDWLEEFSYRLEAGDVDGLISDLLHPEPWWRDLFALTWDIRTFQGGQKISRFLQDRLPQVQLHDLQLLSATFQRPYPDLGWIFAQFTFETSIGLGRGDARLVYTKSHSWKAVTVYTNLEGLKNHPERLDAHRDFRSDHGRWLDQREQETQFAGRDPEVLIIGGGQSGLEVAARLNALGVSNLVVERSARIGDSWRHRYESLSLHGPICTPRSICSIFLLSDLVYRAEPYALFFVSCVLRKL